MAERILNITCPHCKHGIKHDTLMGTTSSIPPEEYPKVNEAGRCWCKMCQHGTFPTEDGLCTECLDKGRETRLRPKTKSGAVEIVVEEPVEEPAKEVGVTLDAIKMPGVKKPKNTKVLR